MPPATSTFSVRVDAAASPPMRRTARVPRDHHSGHRRTIRHRPGCARESVRRQRRQLDGYGVLASCNRTERTIRNGIKVPEALAFDSAGSLYVANATRGADAIGWIGVYAPRSTTPSRTIATGTNLPTWLAFGANGDLYVANVSNVSSGSVAVYANGASKPARRMTNGVDDPLSLLLCAPAA